MQTWGSLLHPYGISKSVGFGCNFSVKNQTGYAVQHSCNYQKVARSGYETRVKLEFLRTSVKTTDDHGDVTLQDQLWDIFPYSTLWSKGTEEHNSAAENVWKEPPSFYTQAAYVSTTNTVSSSHEACKWECPSIFTSLSRHIQLEVILNPLVYAPEDLTFKCHQLRLNKMESFDPISPQQLNLLPRVRLAGSRPYVRQIIHNKLLFSSIIKITVRSKGAARRPLAFYYM